ncbi:hypothetical protein TRICI_006534 [Trichomonascus ciferrii]|uniref:Sulfatase N-terminal domain-containing protein n=1 Tax=Trichomonascus ciferrii TaxID=44093 RepID=A0A642UIS2_9ASCO|nr:hypothetical protein TRICI_006534 [Trichomonascus ciferrii]
MTRPNILFVMADDHASKAISCYGHGINDTPNIDRLAKEGMLLNHCYVTNSICTPSRASILTGTYNHVNGVYTLDSKINKRLPNVAKHLRQGGYQTAMVGKWHLGEGVQHEPTGFDYWSVVPGQGDYFDPEFIEMGESKKETGYATDIITDKTLDFLKSRDKSKPFFAMCHHKAPHRSWECHPKHREWYKKEIKVPETYNEDYKDRVKAAQEAKMRVDVDMTYFDLGLAQPDGGENEVGEILVAGQRKIPNPQDVSNLKLVDKSTGEVFTFRDHQDLRHFKYQRYMQRYLRTIQSIDDSMARLLNYLDENDLTDDTIVIYTSDQGFFLGDHGWFDKRFMYEESFQMPFLIRYPAQIKPGTVCNDIVSNVDFAPTFLDFAGERVPNYMQGSSFKQALLGNTPKNWPQLAYHRYWMHRDEFHNAYAHYGIRDHRYKIIYWYNEGYGLEGTNHGGEDREWELYDCQEDPLELFNVYHDPKFSDIVVRMTKALEDKMVEIGDCIEHR